MKTQVFVDKKGIFNLGLVWTLIIGLLISNPLFSQNTASAVQGKTIKGIVTTSDGPLYGANILLKGTNAGTTTNELGEFTFPRALKINDVLIFSYLSYETQEIRITADKNFLSVKMTDDLVEILGAPASEKPYKSKRKKNKL